MCNYGSCFGALGLTDQEIIDHAEELQLVEHEIGVGCAAVTNPDPQLASNATGLRYKWEWIEVERNGTVVKKPLGSIRASLGSMSRLVDVDALASFLLANYKDVETDPQPDEFDPPLLDHAFKTMEDNNGANDNSGAVNLTPVSLLLILLGASLALGLIEIHVHHHNNNIKYFLLYFYSFLWFEEGVDNMKHKSFSPPFCSNTFPDPQTTQPKRCLSIKISLLVTSSLPLL